jgi:hypothetical protein
VDPFVVIMGGIVGGLLVSLVLLGLFHPRSGADVVDWKPTRSAEVDLQNEIDDLDQMLEATNARRRRRGEPELTEAGLRDEVGRDLAERSRRRDDYLEDLDVTQMLEVKNQRRRRKGLPEISEAEFRASVEQDGRA